MRRTPPKIDSNGGFAAPTDNCCTRLCADVSGPFRCSPSFSATDGNKPIDVRASFSPKGYVALAVKILTLGTCVAVIYFGLLKEPNVFWLAYLTTWSVIFSTLYSLMSLMNMIIPVSQPAAGHSIVGFRAKITWLLFELSANVGILVTVGYWAVLFSRTLDILDLVSHGGITLLVLVDGLGINTIPVRLRHYVEFIFPFLFLYLLWSYLHKAFDVGNPTTSDEDPETNDDLIYDQLDWNEAPLKTGIIAIVLVTVVSPLVQMSLWAFSSWRRRYMDSYVEAAYDEKSAFQAM